MGKTKAFMEFLIDSRVENLPAIALAEVFDRLIWCMADNGHDILSIRLEWLKSDDVYKVDVALSMIEVFPFEDKSEMHRAFARIIQRWPQLQEKCDSWCAQWEKQRT